LTRSVETNIERMYRLFSIFTTNAMKFNHHYSRKKKSLFYLPFTQTGTRYSRLKLKILNRRISKRNSSFYFVTFAISFVTTWFFALKEKSVYLFDISFINRFEHTLQPLRGRSDWGTVVLAVLGRKKNSIGNNDVKTNQICTSLIWMHWDYVQVLKLLLLFVLLHVVHHYDN
jgi:hypothetical protein